MCVCGGAPFLLLKFDYGVFVDIWPVLCRADTLIMDFKGMSIGLVNRDFLW